MTRIYGFKSKSFNIFKVLMAAEELNVDFEFVPLDNKKREHKSLQHLERHPLGKVPVLEHNKRFLFESNAISKYLTTLSENKMYPSDSWKRAKIDQWCDMMAQHTGRWIGVIHFQEIVRSKAQGLSPNTDALKEAKGFLKTQIPVLDRELQLNEFLAGGEFTIADVIAFSYLNVCENTSLEIGTHRNLKRWYDAIKARPSYSKAQSHFCSDA